MKFQKFPSIYGILERQETGGSLLKSILIFFLFSFFCHAAFTDVDAIMTERINENINNRVDQYNVNVVERTTPNPDGSTTKTTNISIPKDLLTPDKSSALTGESNNSSHNLGGFDEPVQETGGSQIPDIGNIDPTVTIQKQEVQPSAGDPKVSGFKSTYNQLDRVNRCIRKYNQRCAIECSLNTNKILNNGADGVSGGLDSFNQTSSADSGLEAFDQAKGLSEKAKKTYEDSIVSCQLAAKNVIDDCEKAKEVVESQISSCKSEVQNQASSEHEKNKKIRACDNNADKLNDHISESIDLCKNSEKRFAKAASENILGHEVAAEQSGIGKTALIAGGLAAAGIGAMMLMGGKDEKKDEKPEAQEESKSEACGEFDYNCLCKSDQASLHPICSACNESSDDKEKTSCYCNASKNNDAAQEALKCDTSPTSPSQLVRNPNPKSPMYNQLQKIRNAREKNYPAADRKPSSY